MGSQILAVEPFAQSVAPVAALGESRSTTSAVGSAPATPTSTIPRASAPTSTPYRVLTVKRGARTFVAVDGGMGDNLEVALYGQRFEAAIADRVSAGGDVLIDEIALPRPRVGDLLAVPTTGAYCFTLANNYNGTRRLPVVFASEGAARLVVQRETLADLLARDVG